MPCHACPATAGMHVKRHTLWQAALLSRMPQGTHTLNYCACTCAVQCTCTCVWGGGCMLAALRCADALCPVHSVSQQPVLVRQACT